MTFTLALFGPKKEIFLHQAGYIRGLKRMLVI
jgi:hypothetical protein